MIYHELQNYKLFLVTSVFKHGEENLRYVQDSWNGERESLRKWKSEDFYYYYHPKLRTKVRSGGPDQIETEYFDACKYENRYTLDDPTNTLKL